MEGQELYVMALTPWQFELGIVVFGIVMAILVVIGFGFGYLFARTEIRYKAYMNSDYIYKFVTMHRFKKFEDLTPRDYYWYIWGLKPKYTDDY